MTANVNNKEIDITGFTMPAIYCIKVRGVIDRHYIGFFGEMVLTTEDRNGSQITSVLKGKIKDQSELMGVMNALYNLHLPIISIQTLD